MTLSPGHKCAQVRARGTKNEDMRRRQDKTEVCDCDGKETKRTGTTDEPHLIVKNVRAREEKGEDDGT